MFSDIDFFGLSKKSKLFSISSNSSFTECVRKHDIVAVSSSFIANSNCALPTYTDCSFTQVNRTSLSSSASFTSCTWTSCQANNGGGIYLKAGSSVTLSVAKSEFRSCKADPYRGGGIYVEGIGNAKTEETLFHECTCKATNDAGGVGIEMWSIQKPPTIETTNFISCESGNDGGGLGIWNAVRFQETCVKGCRFILCRGNNTSSSGGGGMIVWSSYAAIGCSACIFVSCYGAQIGGGLCYAIASSSTFKNRPLSSFCFFKDNSSPSGNDVHFHDWKPSAPFFHCSSTTTRTPRIYPSGNDNNWPPPNINFEQWKILI